MTLTGSISGKVICQKACQALAPSTLAASSTSFGSACRPASSRIIMKGIETQASIAMMLSRAIQGEAKKAGLSQPRIAGQRGGRAEAVLHDRLADHPAHRDRAQHEGQQEDDAEEFARPDVGVEQQREAEGDRVLDRAPPAHRRPCCRARSSNRGRANSARRLSRPLKWRPVERAQVPVGEGDVEAEEGREDHHRDGEQDGRQHEQRPLPALAADHHLAAPSATAQSR